MTVDEFLGKWDAGSVVVSLRMFRNKDDEYEMNTQVMMVCLLREFIIMKPKDFNPAVIWNLTISSGRLKAMAETVSGYQYSAAVALASAFYVNGFDKLMKEKNKNVQDRIIVMLKDKGIIIMGEGNE